MKKTIKLAVVAALALGATSAFATNGSTLIGLGAKSRGMAGTSIGISHGAESALSNGALITSVESTEISFGGTLFMPDVTFDSGAGAKSSAADMSVIPEVSIASKVTDNLYIGVGMWGTAGMGTDYRNDPSAFKMVTNLQLMQFGVPIAYKTAGLSLAVTPILQYGSLDIDFFDLAGNHVGNGVSQDLQFGYNLGVSYEISALTVGAMYKSEIEMSYDKQISTAGAAFGLTLGDKLSTPAEIGVGASYVMGENTFAIDYKQIQWSSAKGYQEFQWDDQNVISLGYEYTTEKWAARLGYNYASSPIKTTNNQSIDTMNLLGFPAIVETHYALGGTYVFSKQTSVDLALTYAPETTQSRVVNFGGGPQTLTTKHSQTSVSAQVNFDF